MTYTKILVLVVALGAVACGRGTSESLPPSSPPAPPAAGDHADPNDGDARLRIDPSMRRDLRVTTAVVESRAGTEQVTLLGEFAVDERAYAEVGVPIAARVHRLLSSTGEAVRAGQPLLELTSPDLGRARAEYVSASAQVHLAEAALERARSLAAEHIVPLREVQEAERVAVAARAAVRAVRATVTAFGVPLPEGESDPASSTFTLRAPIDGVVIERHAVVGQMLDPSQPAFRVGNLSTLWLIVHASERDAVRITPGGTAHLGLPALPGRRIDGTVSLVGRQVEPASRTVPVRIDVRNPDGVLRPGMSATASVAVGGVRTATLTVPVSAVQRVRDTWCVFLPRDGGNFEIRQIGRGRDLDNNVEVLSGLEAGETVVVDGAFLLKAQAERGASHYDH